MILVERSGKIYLMKPNEDDTTFESYSKLWAIASENPNTTQEYQVIEKKVRKYMNRQLYECEYGSEDDEYHPSKLYSTW